MSIKYGTIFYSIWLLLLAPSLSATAQEVISVHGSGTTNPSKCYWTIMDQMNIQAKNPIRMTYRAVGSSTGQAEFIGNGSVSDVMFASGDIPMSADKYEQFGETILHLPVLLGAIAFFHSVPTGKERLNIAPCTLAKIFRRDIVDWNDDEIMQANPNLSLPNPSPITVAHRVKGSSSTASITSYLNQVCPEEWPEELGGKTIDWPEDTIGCEGSGGMSTCIKDNIGTIGYIDMGHGHSEGLPEIELLNAAQKYINSKEAALVGGIMAAAENAALPDALEGSFVDVNLLNQDGQNTWPIVAMTYIYVKKDLTFISDPASQSLVKAFLEAVYSDEYITQCEEEFGFVRVAGELRDKALEAINTLILSPDAPEWSFEIDTEPRIGARDYVISSKRKAYSELEQDSLVEMIDYLALQVDILKAQNEELMTGGGSSNQIRETNSGNSFEGFIDEELDEDSQVKTALVLSAISIALWGIAILALFVKFMGSGSGPNATAAPGSSGMEASFN